VTAELIRIFSDIHYGDPASRVHRLAQLRPLLDGVFELVLNGDTLDTRPSPRPQFTAEIRAEVLAFFPAQVPRVTFVTGNHDPDLSAQSTLDLAGGQIFVTHGDILFDNIVPWGRDAPVIGEKISAGLAALPPPARGQLAERLAVWRRVAAEIPQRHQSKPRGLSYAIGFIADTAWPPLRVLRVLQAWREEPARAAELARRYRPKAKFVLLGHTHKPFVRHTPSGVTVLNTGAFCPPFGSHAIDLTPGRLTVRCIEERGGEFHAGAIVAEFSLAEADASPRLPP
jgi:predicted phosphodiesterase